MGLQQQAASQDTVDFAGYLQSAQCHHGNQTEGQVQSCQKSPHREHNSSFTSTKGLLNGPGQNNCFLNSAVQVSGSSGTIRNVDTCGTLLRILLPCFVRSVVLGKKTRVSEKVATSVRFSREGYDRFCRRLDCNLAAIARVRLVGK